MSSGSWNMHPWRVTWFSQTLRTSWNQSLIFPAWYLKVKYLPGGGYSYWNTERDTVSMIIPDTGICGNTEVFTFLFLISAEPGMTLNVDVLVYDCGLYMLLVNRVCFQYFTILQVSN